MATYANQKCTEMGATVVAMSDSNGYVVDENGIDFRIIQQIKEQKRERISTYPNYVPTAKYVEGCASIWSVSCDIAMPCATQNEIDTDSAKLLVSNGCKAVFEGSNMPCSRGHPGHQSLRPPLLPLQGFQRRRCGCLRPGDEPEQRAPVLDLEAVDAPS